MGQGWRGRPVDSLTLVYSTLVLIPVPPPPLPSYSLAPLLPPNLQLRFPKSVFRFLSPCRTHHAGHYYLWAQGFRCMLSTPSSDPAPAPLPSTTQPYPATCRACVHLMSHRYLEEKYPNDHFLNHLPQLASPRVPTLSPNLTPRSTLRPLHHHSHIPGGLSAFDSVGPRVHAAQWLEVRAACV